MPERASLKGATAGECRLRLSLPQKVFSMRLLRLVSGGRRVAPGSIIVPEFGAP
jgi:hypothetical protein